MDDTLPKANATAKSSTATPQGPNMHFYQWLTENKYEVSVDALSDNNHYVEGKGFVLTDKPLLVVTIKKKEDTA